MHRQVLLARIGLITICGGVGAFPVCSGTPVPCCLDMGQIMLIASLIWTLVQGDRHTRRAATPIPPPTKRKGQNPR